MIRDKVRKVSSQDLVELDLTLIELNAIKFALLKEYESVNRSADKFITRYESNTVTLSILAKLDSAESITLWCQLQAAENSKRFPEMEVDSNLTDLANLLTTDKKTSAEIALDELDKEIF